MTNKTEIVKNKDIAALNLPAGYQGQIEINILYGFWHAVRFGMALTWGVFIAVGQLILLVRLYIYLSKFL